MCELLVFVRNNTNADPEKDRRGCYKVGYVVIAVDDGYTWGREESKAQWVADGGAAGSWPGQGRWVIIKIPGISAAKAKELINEQREDDAGVQTSTVYRRRLWRVKHELLPLAIRNQLAADGEITVTLAQVRNYIKRIRDDAQYTGLD